MKKQKFKISLIILIILVIVIIGIIKVLEKNKNDNENVDKYNEIYSTQFTKEYLQDRVVPQGIYQFTKKYKGEVTREILYERLNIVTQYLTDLSKEIDGKDIEQFYDANTEQILEYLGIDNKNDFVNICKVINERNIKDTTFKYCVIGEEDFEIQGGYTKFYIDFCYENETKIKLQMHLSNVQNDNKPILKVMSLEF